MIHADECVVDREKRNLDVAGVEILPWQLATKELHGEDSPEECEEEHKNDKVKETGNVPQHNKLA